MLKARLRRRDENGAAAVEFALVVPFLLLIFFAVLQYGVYFWSYQTGTNAANQAARQLAVGNCQTAGALGTYVDQQIGSAEKGSATVTTVWKNPDGSAPAAPAAAKVGIGGNVQVTVTFESLNFHFPFVPFLSSATVVRTVQARVEDTTDQGCGS